MINKSNWKLLSPKFFILHYPSIHHKPQHLEIIKSTNFSKNNWPPKKKNYFNKRDLTTYDKYIKSPSKIRDDCEFLNDWNKYLKWLIYMKLNFSSTCMNQMHVYELFFPPFSTCVSTLFCVSVIWPCYTSVEKTNGSSLVSSSSTSDLWHVFKK
jgi:hypothetical protein